MDGRGRPVKEDERLSGSVVRRDDEERETPRAAAPQNDFEGVREAQGARRPSTTMGADINALHVAEQMASLDGRHEQDEMLQQQQQQQQEQLRRRNGQRRGSRTNLEEVIEFNMFSMHPQQQAADASSFIYALQQQRQQQQQMQQMTAGGLKTFPAASSAAAPSPAGGFVDWSSQLPPDVMIDSSYEPPAEPERPIAARGRRPSIGQLF